MKIVFITINDHTYLPNFFENFFAKAKPEDSFKVLIVKPLYKNESTLTMAKKYLKTFGIKEFLSFSTEFVVNKLMALSNKLLQGSQVYCVKDTFSKKEYEIVDVEGDVNQSNIINLLVEWDVDLIVSLGSPQLLQSAIINLPACGCLNIHGSPLPKYRGVLPSFWMLKNKEKYAFNTIFYVNKTIDGGDILIQESFPISEKDTLKSLIIKSKLTASDMLLKAIAMIKAKQTVTSPINVAEGSYFSWPTRQDVLEFLATGRKLR